MKTTKTIGKRLFAGMLALLMLVTLLPVSVLALNADGLTATLTHEVETLADPSVESGSEGGEEPSAPITGQRTHTYTLTVQLNGAAVTDGVQVTWTGDVSGEDAFTKTFVESVVWNSENTEWVSATASSAPEAVISALSYKGLNFANAGELTAATSITWAPGALSGAKAEYTYGVDKEYLAPTGVANLTVEEGNAVFSFAFTKDDENEVKEVAAAHIGEYVVGTATVTVDDKTVYSGDYKAAVKAPTVAYSATVGGAAFEAAKWYKGDEDVVITATIEQDLYDGFFAANKDSLRDLLGIDSSKYTAGETAYSYSGKLSDLAVELGEKVEAPQIDTTAPVVVSIAKAYLNDGKTNVVVNYTETESGIVKVSYTANDEIAYTDITVPVETDGSVEFTIPYAVEQITALKLTDAIGNEGTHATGFTPAEDMSLTMTAPAADYTSGDDRYLKAAAGEITVTLDGVEIENTAPYHVIEGWESDEKTVTYNLADQTITDGVIFASKTITVTDNVGRTRSVTIPAYKLDNTAPAITVTALSGSEAEPAYKQSFSANISVSDNLGLSQVEVVVNGKSKTYTVDGNAKEWNHSISVKNSETLKEIKVYALDVCGNPASVSKTGYIVVDNVAPHVTATIAASNNGSKSVIQSFNQYGGRWFAVIDPMTFDETGVASPSNEHNTEISVTVTVTDTNLDPTLYDGWNVTGTTAVKTFTTSVAPNHAGQLKVDFTAVDLAGNAATNDITFRGETVANAMATSYDAARQDGVYGINLYVDRRTPEDAIDSEGNDKADPESFDVTDTKAAPAITLNFNNEFYNHTTVTENGGSVNRRILTGNNVKLNLRIWDIGSGLQLEKQENDVTYTVSYQFVTNGGEPASGGWKNVGAVLAGGTAYGDTLNYKKFNGDVEILNIPAIKTENNNVALYVRLRDAVGNTYWFKEVFGIDNKAPRVEVTREGEKLSKLTAETYFSDKQTYEISVTDAYLMEATAQIKLNGESTLKEINLMGDGVALEGNKRTYSFTLDNEQYIEEIHVVAKDYFASVEKYTDASNRVTKLDFTGFEAVDLNAPVITITPDALPAKAADNIYYVADKDQFTFNITVTDWSLDTAPTVVYNGNKLSADEINWTAPTASDRYAAETYTAKIVLNKGETLTGLVVTAKDSAGNGGEAKFEETVSVDDGSDPVVKVTKNGTVSNTLSGVDYYTDPVSYEITVTDRYLSADVGTAKVVVIHSDNTTDIIDLFTLDSAKTGTNGAEDTYKYTVALTDGARVKDIEVIAIDNFGNAATELANKDKVADWSGMEYDGNPIVVDETAPVVSIVYVNNNATNGKYFRDGRTISVYVQDDNFDSKLTDLWQITNVGGTTNGWSKNEQGYVITYNYPTDGDYQFEVKEIKDFAGNKAKIDYAGAAAPNDFVVDLTDPVISVTFNPAKPVDTDRQGVDYYDQDVTATVRITEKNFNAADVKAVFGSNHKLSAFTEVAENVHQATVTFGEGNEYDFGINYTDLSGRAAKGYESRTFSVDKGAPTITVSRGNMKNAELNIVQGDLVLGFTINDDESNLKDYQVNVTHVNNQFSNRTVSGANYYTVTPDGDGRTRVTINFTNIAKERAMDGVYTVAISASDYAGHDVSLTPALQFSLNRHGSSFMTADNFTAGFLTGGENGIYHQGVDSDLVIMEINPNKVWQDSARQKDGSVLTLMANGKSTVLSEGSDYTMSVTQKGGARGWYVYTYKINSDLFLSNGAVADGTYSLLLYGEDEAGNKNTNEADKNGNLGKTADGTYSGKIEFTLDSKQPVITTMGIESGEAYNEQFRRMTINIADSSASAIRVLVNGQEVTLSETMAGLSDSEVWLAPDGKDTYVLNLVELDKLFGSQTVEIQATDEAGNVSNAVVDDIVISSNLLVRITNSPATMILIGIGVVGGLWLLFFLLKKRKEEEEENEVEV